MTLTIEVPERVVAKAAELGVPVETLVSRAINGIGAEPIPEGFRLLRGDEPAKYTPEEAGAVIREIQSRSTLGGITIKELVEGGRRY